MVRQTSGSSCSPTPSLESLAPAATAPAPLETQSSSSSSGLGSSPLANSVLGLSDGHVGCSVIGEPPVTATQLHLCCETHPMLSNSTVAGPELDSIRQLVEESQLRIGDLRAVAKNAENCRQKLAKNVGQVQNEICEHFNQMQRFIEERKSETLRELDNAITAKQMDLALVAQRARDVVDNIQQLSDFVENLLKRAVGGELQVCKRPLEQRLNSLLQEASQAAFTSDCHNEEVHFQAQNSTLVKEAIKNVCGEVRLAKQQPPISRPVQNSNGSNEEQHNGHNMAPSHSTGHLKNLLLDPGLSLSQSSSVFHLPSGLTSGFESSSSSTADSGTSSTSSSGNSALGKSFFRGLNSLITDLPATNDYERWSNGANESSKLYQGLMAPPQSNQVVGFHSLINHNGLMNNSSNFGLMDSNKFGVTSNLMGAMRSPQMRRQKMIYHCKFGEFGIMEGQFTEPSGVAVNAQNDIIVADTNNHRIQIFDREGRFKFQFGECGKRDGQLLYPNRVAVVRQSGDIVVTERSPTHQVQIYNQYGQFVRKFGATILQHPRGVCVDSMGRIIVVECKVMRVIIFDQRGNVLNKFGCSKHLEFPNGVVVNDRQEIFISDNRAHCVKVFSYEGIFLRQIGGEGITNYPIGVGINSSGHVTIADNHNNFNLTVFTQDGQLVSALESKVKHAQCFDVALMDDGSVVLASKDYRLYVYRYLQTL